MKKLLLTTVAMATLGLSAGAVQAAGGNEASATASATATVVTPITLTVVDDLDFGSFTVGIAGGIVNSNTGPDGADVIAVPNSSNTNQDATFNVGGDTSQTFVILGGSTDTSVTLENGTGDQMIATLTSTASGTAIPAVVTVNGELTVPSGVVAPGVYDTSNTDDFIVTVAYN